MQLTLCFLELSWTHFFLVSFGLNFVDVRLELKTGPNAMITLSRFVNIQFPVCSKDTPTASESEQSTHTESAKHPACLIPSLPWTPLSLRGSMVGLTGFSAEKDHPCLLYDYIVWKLEKMCPVVACVPNLSAVLLGLGRDFWHCHICECLFCYSLLLTGQRGTYKYDITNSLDINPGLICNLYKVMYSKY